jgi:hypothetical protein
MSTTLQTIEPDDTTTVTANSQSQSPTRNAEPPRRPPVLGAIAGSTSPGDTEAGTVTLPTLSPVRVLTHSPLMHSKVSQEYFVRYDLSGRLARRHVLISYGLVRAPRRALRLVPLPFSCHSDLHPLRVLHG